MSLTTLSVLLAVAVIGGAVLVLTRIIPGIPSQVPRPDPGPDCPEGEDCPQ